MGSDVQVCDNRIQGCTHFSFSENKCAHLACCTRKGARTHRPSKPNRWASQKKQNQSTFSRTNYEHARKPPEMVTPGGFLSGTAQQEYHTHLKGLDRGVYPLEERKVGNIRQSHLSLSGVAAKPAACLSFPRRRGS